MSHSVKNFGLDLSLCVKHRDKNLNGCGRNWDTIARQAKRDFAEYKKKPIDRTIDKIGKYSV